MRFLLSATVLAFVAPSLIFSPVSGESSDMAVRIMKTLYSNVLDPLTYVQPGSSGVQPAVDPKTEHVQLLPTGYPLSVNDIDDIWTNGHLKGNMVQTEYFTSTVDGDLAFTYGNSLKSFTPVSDAKDLDKEDKLQKAQAYLSHWIDVTELDGTVSKTDEPTPVYAAYKKRKRAYNNAVTAFRTAFSRYDMNNKTDQIAWMTVRPSLQDQLDTTFDDYRAIAPRVEQALNVINSFSTATLSSSLIEAAIIDYKNTEFGSLANPLMKWHATFPHPYNFGTDDSGFNQITVSSSRLKETSSDEFEQWGGGGSWSYGLWSVGGGASGTNKESRSHTENTDITMTFNLGLVRLERSWFHPSLFQIGGWYVNGQNKGVISDGQNPGDNHGIIPSYRTGMLVVKNLTITGDFASKDTELIEKIREGSTRVGFGPFCVGGSYSSSTGSQKLEVIVDKNSIRVPGMQILGWINSIVPLAPQMDDPKPH